MSRNHLPENSAYPVPTEAANAHTPIVQSVNPFGRKMDNYNLYKCHIVVSQITVFTISTDICVCIGMLGPSVTFVVDISRGWTDTKRSIFNLSLTNYLNLFSLV